MSTAPRAQAGVASGILNMARGLGTALGLALTGLVLGVAATEHSRTAASHGFEVATLLLAFVALAAAVLSAGIPGLRRPQRRDRGDRSRPAGGFVAARRPPDPVA